MDFTTYLSDGQMVCTAHHLIVCGKCCVDFTSPASQLGSDEEEDDNRIFVLGLGVNRFLPQHDEQTLRPENTSRINQ